jgi:hypothetical protein
MRETRDVVCTIRVSRRERELLRQESQRTGKDISTLLQEGYVAILRFRHQKKQRPMFSA